MADVFISYNREDQHRARTIAEALQAEGLSVWWDSHLRAGQSYDEVTEKNLREAGAVAVLWSTRSVNSKWVRAEATIGERCSTLTPAMIEECERPLRFELVQTADLTRWQGDASDPNWKSFVHDIKSAIGKHETTAPAAQFDAAVNASAAPGAADVTIENTFWTSIKDGTDRSDFEAYLKRYPQGHFADLARNRLAAFDRAAAEDAERRSAARAEAEREEAARREAERKEAELRERKRREAESREAASRPVPQEVRRDPVAPARKAQSSTVQARRPASRAGDPRRGAARTPPPASGKGGRGLGAIGLGALGLAALGFGGFFLTQQGASSTARSPAASAEVRERTATRPAEPPAEVAAAERGPATRPEPPAESAERAQLDAPADNPLDGAGRESPAAGALGPGETFADCEACPRMTIVPSGVFTMGSPDDEPGRDPYEGPQREVAVSSFAISAHEVTFDQWAACVEDDGCRGYEPRDAGFGVGAQPVLSISWNDARAYVEWLSAKTERAYRLPTEAEWEYAARGGARTPYWWGARFDASKAARGATKEVGTFEPNAFGLYDMHGNAAEWVEDCYVNNYEAAPADQSAVLSGDCTRRVVRGGSWKSSPKQMRAANRSRIGRNTRDRSLGFRVAADLDAE